MTTPHSAESPDGTVRAEATAKRQTALHLSPRAMRLPPEDLAALILETQREAQNRAEESLAEKLATFREDPRVTSALDTLRDTQAAPAPRPPRREEDEEETDVAAAVYDRNSSW